MKALDFAGFRAAVKDGAGGGYLFCGAEGYLMRHALKLLVKAVFGGADDPFNHLRIDYTADRGVPEAVGALPAFADRRLVEVWGCDFAHGTVEALEPVYDAIAMLPDNPQTVLVVCATPYELDLEGGNKASQKAYDLLSADLCPVIFEKETPAALAKWAAAHFAHEGITISREDAQALIDRAGRDMYALTGEVDKLCAWVRADGRDAVRREDILKVTTSSPEIGTYDFSNAILAGKFDRAMMIFSDMKSRKREPMFILGVITSCYTRMQRAAVLAGGGMSAEEIARIMKLKPYPVKLSLNAARSLGRKRLQKALELCSETDYKVKFTGGDNYVKVSRLMAQLAAL